MKGGSGGSTLVEVVERQRTVGTRMKSLNVDDMGYHVIMIMLIIRNVTRDEVKKIQTNLLEESFRKGLVG